MRITQLQFDRLVGARERDGMAVQEHVRRALDLYLDKVEREAARAPVTTGPPAANGVVVDPVQADAVRSTAAELLAEDALRRTNAPAFSRGAQRVRPR